MIFRETIRRKNISIFLQLVCFVQCNMFTARIRRMGKVIVSVCLFVHTYPGMGYPTPGIGQQMEYLIRGERYACFVRAGGLSCLNFMVTNKSVSAMGKVLTVAKSNQFDLQQQPIETLRSASLDAS